MTEQKQEYTAEMVTPKMVAEFFADRGREFPNEAQILITRHLLSRAITASLLWTEVRRLTGELKNLSELVLDFSDRLRECGYGKTSDKSLPAEIDMLVETAQTMLQNTRKAEEACK